MYILNLKCTKSWIKIKSVFLETDYIKSFYIIFKNLIIYCNLKHKYIKDIPVLKYVTITVL